MSINKLISISKEIKKDVLNMCFNAQIGHIGSAFSIVDLLVVLYFKILNLNISNLDDPNRDRLVLSKGHACSALYACLAKKKFFSKEMLFNKFHCDGGVLHGHPCKGVVPGIEVTTGSLGQGFSVAAGIALAGKINRLSYRTFVISSEGECNEGQVWEAVMFAAQHRLDNLIAIIDVNRLQAFGESKDILNLEPLLDKWTSFGWEAVRVDGHNFRQIVNVLDNLPLSVNKPTVIIADTIKGKGVSFMENKLDSHYMHLDKEKLYIAFKDIDKL